MKIFKIAGITLAILSVVGEVTYSSLKPVSKSKTNNQITIQKKTDEKEKKRNTSEVEADEKKEEPGEVSENSSNSNILNEEKSNNNTQNKTKEENNSGSYRQENSSPTSSVSPPPAPKTAWELLGISEYDYYNSPAPNEGEIAKDIVDCEAKSEEITNKYGFVTHSGDVYSYSENYIGCWITVHFPDGRRMFYNEFDSRANRGEF